MVEKLSSIKIISAASRATSLPRLPIATPISAFFKAGASLTPSPVMAVISPFSRSAPTIRILCSGVTREKTPVSCTCRRSSCSSMASSISPVIILSAFGMPTFRAIAEAVTPLSPVIMMTRIPARLQTAISSATDSRGGSARPIRPRSSSRHSVMFPGTACSDTGLPDATAITRSPSPAIFAARVSASSRAVSGISQRVRIFSGEPFAAMSSSPSCRQT